jgi:thioesterase III
MISCIEIKVRGYHIDYYRHVNNARYLEFLEEGRWVFFERDVDFRGLLGKGYIFVVVNINIHYTHPASLGDILEIRTSISRLGQDKGTMHQKIFLKGTSTIIVDAEVKFVILDSSTKIRATIPERFRAALEKYKDL